MIGDDDDDEEAFTGRVTRSAGARVPGCRARGLRMRWPGRPRTSRPPIPALDRVPLACSPVLFGIVYLALDGRMDPRGAVPPDPAAPASLAEVLWQFGEFTAIVAAPLWFGADAHVDPRRPAGHPRRLAGPRRRPPRAVAAAPAPGGGGMSADRHAAGPRRRGRPAALSIVLVALLFAALHGYTLLQAVSNLVALPERLPAARDRRRRAVVAARRRRRGARRAVRRSACCSGGGAASRTACCCWRCRSAPRTRSR